MNKPVTIRITLEDAFGNYLISSDVSIEMWKDVKQFHNISALDEVTQQLIKEVENGGLNKKDN